VARMDLTTGSPNGSPGGLSNWKQTAPACRGQLELRVFEWRIPSKRIEPAGLMARRGAAMGSSNGGFFGSSGKAAWESSQWRV